MGLDQYLTKKIYTRNWNYEKEAPKFEVTVKIDGKEYPVNEVESVDIELFYWRKANQFHKWCPAL